MDDVIELIMYPLLGAGLKAVVRRRRREAGISR
jgi:hypothetical protein